MKFDFCFVVGCLIFGCLRPFPNLVVGCLVVGCLRPYPNLPLMFLMTGDECLNSAVTKRILRESVGVLGGDEGLLGMLLT